MNRPRATKVVACDDYCVKVTFSNNEERLFDVKPYLEFAAFRELKNKALFATVKAAGLSVAWIHGQDICPDDLYFKSSPCL